jgi:ankyrin repeat protein
MQNEDTNTDDVCYEEDIPSVEQDPLHDNDPPIHKASYKGDIALITSLLDNGTATKDINTRNIRAYCTPLHLAIRADHGSIVRVLLQAGADPTLKDEIEPCYFVSLSALDLAAWLGQQNALAALLDHEISIPASSLLFSASRNRAVCLALILEKLGDRDFSDMSRLEAIRQAINSAALCWHVEAFELLLKYYQAFPDSVRLQGNGEALGAALTCALYDYDCDNRCRPPVVCCPIDDRLSSILESLMKAGADVNTRDDQGRHSSAFWACLHSPTVPRDVVRLLLDNGLRVDSVSHNGNSQLSGIIRDTNDDPSLVEELIRAGASVADTDEDGYTPLHSVAHVSFAEVLVANGADVSARTPQGQTPLHTACKRGNLSVAKLLLAHGANVHDAVPENGWTPLLFAAGDTDGLYESTSEKCLQLVQLLRLHGANLHITGSDGLTALHKAAESSNKELVHYLIDCGVDIHAKTTCGMTPLHYASTVVTPHGGVETTSVVRMLLEHGADLNATDQAGQTSLMKSVAECSRLWGFSPTVCNLLLENGAEKAVCDAEGKTVADIINNSDSWIFGDDGLVREKPRPVYAASRGGGRGRWRGVRGRGVSRSNSVSATVEHH